MDADVPLVVAEVNPDDVRDLPRGIVVVPELHDDGAAHRAGAAPPGGRASSGWSCRPTSRCRAPGSPGMHELDEQWTKGAGQAERLRRAGAPRRVEPGEVWDRPIAGNVIPLAGSVKEAGYTSEEWKLVRESRKILHAPELRVTRHLRAGAGVRRARGGRQRASSTRRCRAPRPSSCSRARRVCSSSTAATAHPRRSRVPGSTRCWSGGCARTRRRSARSTSGSPATTCARAPRSTRIQLAELLLELTTARSPELARRRPVTRAGRAHAVQRARATSVTRNTCPMSASNVTSTRPVSVRGGEVAVAHRRQGDEAEVQEVDVGLGARLREEAAWLDVVDPRRRCRRRRCRAARRRRPRRGSSRGR